MPAAPTRRPPGADADRGRDWSRCGRFVWAVSLTLIGGVVAGYGVLDHDRATGRAAPPMIQPTATLTPPTTGGPLPGDAPPATSSPTPAAPILKMPGSFPSSGPGTYTYATSSSRVFGRSGSVRRFRVAAEKNVASELPVFTSMIDSTLGDSRSWIGSGSLRLQRVPPGSSYQFTIYLVTAETSGRVCRAGGINNSINGYPYTSCRVGGKVVINLDRWRLSVPHYINEGTPLDAYRRYVINHEVGHVLGYGHERCPGLGRPAPVMAQQTLGLGGCVANWWPYINGRRYSGPPL